MGCTASSEAQDVTAQQRADKNGSRQPPAAQSPLHVDLSTSAVCPTTDRAMPTSAQTSPQLNGGQQDAHRGDEPALADRHNHNNAVGAADADVAIPEQQLSPHTLAASDDALSPACNEPVPPLTADTLRAHTKASNAFLRERRDAGGPRVRGEPRSWYEVMADWLEGLDTNPQPIPSTAAAAADAEDPLHGLAAELTTSGP